jgi:transposase
VSLRNTPLPPIPEEVRKAVKSRKKASPFIAFIDHVGEILEAADFTQMYSVLGQSAIHPGLLVLAVLLQHTEGLSDRQVSERIDDSLTWKYALRLGLHDSGWDPSIYSDFRQRLLNSDCSELILDRLLDIAAEMGLLDPSKQRTDATHILSAARLMNRIELVHECVFDCINELLDEAPRFLIKINKQEWHDRYFKMRPYNYQVPKTDIAKQRLADTVGADAKYILTKIEKFDDADHLNQLQSVQILRRVLDEQFEDKDDGPSFRTKDKLGPAGERLASPDDLDATCGSKRGMTWLGSKAHFTETYGADKPHLITNVKTTAAHVNDSLVLDEIHSELRSKGYKPKVHLVDAGYVDTLTLSKCEGKDEIDVLTRFVNGHSWQSKEGKGFDIDKFVIDWEAKSVTCPTGTASNSWKSKGGDEGVINVSFPSDACKACPFKVDCTHSSSRKLQFKARPVFDFLQECRERQNTPEFRAEYSNRSGSEGTVSQLVRRAKVRRSKYFTREKTHLNNVLSAAAINVIRMGNWLLGIGRAKTRQARYDMLFAATAA